MMMDSASSACGLRDAGPSGARGEVQALARARGGGTRQRGTDGASIIGGIGRGDPPHEQMVARSFDGAPGRSARGRHETRGRGAGWCVYSSGWTGAQLSVGFSLLHGVARGAGRFGAGVGAVASAPHEAGARCGAAAASIPPVAPVAATLAPSVSVAVDVNVAPPVAAVRCCCAARARAFFLRGGREPSTDRMSWMETRRRTSRPTAASWRRKYFWACDATCERGGGSRGARRVVARERSARACGDRGVAACVGVRVLTHCREIERQSPLPKRCAGSNAEREGGRRRRRRRRRRRG